MLVAGCPEILRSYASLEFRGSSRIIPHRGDSRDWVKMTKRLKDYMKKTEYQYKISSEAP